VRVPVFVGGKTGARHSAAIKAAGAIPLGFDLEEGVRAISTALAARKEAR
jgi:hypothetical protein